MNRISVWPLAKVGVVASFAGQSRGPGHALQTLDPNKPFTVAPPVTRTIQAHTQDVKFTDEEMRERAVMMEGEDGK